jgi:PAS domain-containing protein
MRARTVGYGRLTSLDIAAVGELMAAGSDLDFQLDIALDNMPGALVYTDEHLNIVFRNDQFKKMYSVPSELLQPGRPYSAFLRYLAENGYYGGGDINSLVAERVESLRNPLRALRTAHRMGDGTGFFAAAWLVGARSP